MTSDIGPVEYITVAFPGNRFTGEIVPELARLIDAGLIRILDLVFVAKDANGAVLHFEFDQLAELAPFAELEGELRPLISSEDIDYAAASLEPNSSCALLIWEDVWAQPFVEALRRAGAVLAEGGRIPKELVDSALAEMAAEPAG